MKLYLNELAPWERKNEYYHHIQLGKDVKIQTETINNQTKAAIAAQLASTNAIVASQERISEGIDNLSYGIDRVEQGIYGLQATFEWGISEVVWQIEQNREVLRDILQVLSAPLDTQAKELRKRAEEAYANGWIDDALQDFLESENKNRYDFSIHISLGMIYLFHKLDKEKALEYFEKAVKYAKPKSAYHASYALLYKGLIKRDFGFVEEAEKCSAEAIELSPAFSEALYQNAQYNALLSNTEKAIDKINQVIRIDRNYCLKIDNNRDFDPIRLSIDNLFKSLFKSEYKLAEARYEKLVIKIEEINNLINDINKLLNLDLPYTNVIMPKIKSYLERKSYFDSMDANAILVDWKKIPQNSVVNILKELDSIKYKLKKPYYNKAEEDCEKIGKIINNTEIGGPFGCLIAIILSVIGGFIGYIIGGITLSIVCAIPLVILYRYISLNVMFPYRYDLDPYNDFGPKVGMHHKYYLQAQKKIGEDVRINKINKYINRAEGIEKSLRSGPTS